MKKKFANIAYSSYLLWGILSSMAVTVCTIVDATLIGHYIGSDGLAIASIATPIFMFYAFLGITIAIGANVLIGRYLGSADIDSANTQMGKLFFTSLAIGLLILVISLIFQDRITIFLGGQGSLFSLAKSYLMPVFITSPFYLLYQVLTMTVKTDGNSRLAAIASGVLIATNLLLDILFMGYFKIGIQGASFSLCIGEVLSVLLLLTHFNRKLSILKLKLIVPQFSDLAEFIRNGFGVGSAYILQAISMLIFNKILLDNVNGVEYVAIYGVLYTISTIPTGFFDAAANAYGPIISIFIGEQDTKSIMSVFYQGIKFSAIVSLIFCGCVLVATAPMLALFGLEVASLSNAIPALRLFSIAFLFAGFNTLIITFWQTIGRASLAGFMSVLRNFALVLLLGIILISRFNIIGLAYTYISCELLCFIGSLLVLLIHSSNKYVLDHYSPTGRVFEKYYSINTESVADISNDLQLLCENWDIGTKQTFFLNFIVEEILLNVNKLGMKENDGKRYIDIKLLEDNDSYILRIRDNVKAYDPFASSGDNIDNGVLKVIRKNSKVCEYQRKLIFNYLYLII